MDGKLGILVDVDYESMGYSERLSALGILSGRGIFSGPGHQTRDVVKITTLITPGTEGGKLIKASPESSR